jgi:hypothetical protein
LIFLQDVDVRVYNPDSASDRTAIRNLLKRIASALEITDLIVLMMVLVTGLSAYATWKTAQVTNEILLTSQGPYIGTEAVSFTDETNPKIVVDVRNFGSVQAEEATISIVVQVNGRTLRGDSEPQQQEAPVVTRRTASVLSSHRSRYLPRCVQGRTNLVVEIRVRYRGPRGDEHCYLTRHSYDQIDRVFYSQGGSLSCDH